LAAEFWSSCGYTIFSTTANRVVSSEELDAPNIRDSGGCDILISRAVDAAPTPAEVKAAAARAEEEAKKKEKEKAKEAAGVKAATARAVEAEAAARKRELQTQLGKMVVANMTHRLLLNTNQAMVGCSTIGARHCRAFEVEGDGFCLLRSVCDANSEVGNIRKGSGEKCRELLAAMVERQLSSSEKTHLLILSLQKSLGD